MARTIIIAIESPAARVTPSSTKVEGPLRFWRSFTIAIDTSAVRRSRGIASMREADPSSDVTRRPPVSMTAIDQAFVNWFGSESAIGSEIPLGDGLTTRSMADSSSNSMVCSRSSKRRADALARVRLSALTTESALVFACAAESPAYRTNGAMAAATTTNRRLRRLAKGDTGTRQEERTHYGGSGKRRRCLNHTTTVSGRNKWKRLSHAPGSGRWDRRHFRVATLRQRLIYQKSSLGRRRFSGIARP